MGRRMPNIRVLQLGWVSIVSNYNIQIKLMYVEVS